MSNVESTVSRSKSPPGDDSASDLLARARAGQLECLGQLLKRYENYLRILSATQLDAQLRGRVSPSDIVQETYFEAHRDFPQFRGVEEPEFAVWLRQILIKNLLRAVECHILTAKRDVRREKRLNEIGRSLDHSSSRLELLLADRNPSPSSVFQERQRALLVADKLAELTPDYRDVVILRNFRGLSFDEVAQHMKRSVGATRMLWLRALNHLRQLLDECEP
jgi:RNA polymerase sigma-70 factor (ECF subfamily)